MFISVTRTAGPRLPGRTGSGTRRIAADFPAGIGFLRRQPSDSAVTRRQGRAFRVRTSRRPGNRPACTADYWAPCAGGPASPVRTSQCGARLASATPRATGPRCGRPRPVSVLTWACVPVLGAADSSPGITPTRMSELTATLLPAASHIRLSSPRPPPILFYRHEPVSVWESDGRSGSATSGAFRAWRAFLSQQVSRWEYRLAGGKEPRPVRGVQPGTGHPDRWLAVLGA